MEGAFLIALVLYCIIATVSAKMPWGLPVPGCRAVGNVNTGSASAEKSPHMGDLNNHTVVDDGTTVRGGDGIPPSNTPPSQKHAHHQGAFSVSPSTFAGNGLTNGLCCVADGLGSMANGRVDASVNIRNGMGEASANIRNGMGEASANIRNGMGEASANIRNGMVAIGVCMVFGSWLGRS
jgi:hypothetical protein